MKSNDTKTLFLLLTLSAAWQLRVAANAPTLAHLAEMLLTAPGSHTPVARAEAGFLVRRAEALGPGDRSAQASRRRISGQLEPQSTR